MAAFKTAVENILTGQTATLSAATIVENAAVTWPAGANNATIQGAGMDQTVVDWSASAKGNRFTIAPAVGQTLTGITIADLTLKGTGGTNPNQEILASLCSGDNWSDDHYGSLSYVYFKRVKFTGCDGVPVTFSGHSGTHYYFEDCIIDNCSGSGIGGCCNYLYLTRCTVGPNLGVSTGHHGIYFSPDLNLTYGPTYIDRCEFLGPYGSNLQIAAAHGSYPNGRQGLVDIRNSLFWYDNEGAVLYNEGTEQWLKAACNFGSLDELRFVNNVCVNAWWNIALCPKVAILGGRFHLPAGTPAYHFHFDGTPSEIVCCDATFAGSFGALMNAYNTWTGTARGRRNKYIGTAPYTARFTAVYPYDYPTDFAIYKAA